MPLTLTWDDLKFEGYDRGENGGAVQDDWNSNRCWKGWISRLTTRRAADSSDGNCRSIVHGRIYALLGKLDEVRAIHVEVIGENPHQGEVLGIAFAFEDSAYMSARDADDEEAAPSRVAGG